MNSAFWRLHRNKIFAVSFAALAVATFVAQYILTGVFYGWNNVFTGPLPIINASITLGIFLMILVTNIRNDDRAYNGILMFVFLIAWRLVWSFLPQGLSLGSLIGSSRPEYVATAVLDLLLGLGAAGLGVTLYVFVFRYRMGRGDFNLVRLFAVLFALALALLAGADLALYLLSISTISAPYAALCVCAVLPDALMGVAVAFTLERLRRY